MVIDFHTHTFPDKIAARVIDSLSQKSRTLAYADSSVADLIRHMRSAGIDYAVNLPVMSREDQVEHINHSLVERKEDLLQSGIITFGGMHPDYADYRTELKYLAKHGIAGIKLHPAYQGKCIDDIQFLRIIEYASELGLIVLTHAGLDIGIYDRNYATIDQILHVIREIHPDKFVLAHMGNWGAWDAVEKDLCGAPVYFDTAFSLGPIEKRPDLPDPIRTENLDMESAIRIMRKHGTDKILFATDSPWSDMADYVARIRDSALTDDEKEKIFHKNAEKLLGRITLSPAKTLSD